MTTKTRKTALESKLSKVCGFAVELTVRGDNAFTLSAEGNRDFGPAVRFLSLSGRVSDVSSEYDAECDLTCCYLTIS